MIRKILLISVMFIGLAACGSIEETIEETIDLASFGTAEPEQITQWYRAYISLEDDMDNPSSAAFQNYAEQAKASPRFEEDIIAEFDVAVTAVINDPRATPERKRENLKTLTHTLDLLAKHRLVTPVGISRMHASFDRQTATAYIAGRAPLGLQDAPKPARQLPRAIIRQPTTAFQITWRDVENGDYAALDALMDIGRKVAAGGNNQIERMALANLRQARLPFPAWRDHVMKYYPDLAKAKMRALTTPLVARFEFQNRTLGQQTHQRLLKLMPDVYYVANARQAAGVLIIREITFQSTTPEVTQQSHFLNRGSFDYYNKTNFPNINSASWTETTTKMSGQWAIHLDLLKPDGTRIAERTVRGDKTIVAIQCSTPVYEGFGDKKPNGWPNTDATKRCQNQNTPPPKPDHMLNLAIDATMNGVLTLVGPLRKVQAPQTQ